MKFILPTVSAVALATAACAQAPLTPDTPDAPDTPEISTVTEDCGENCTRTVTKIIKKEAGEDGTEFVSKNVEVIELHAGDHEDVDINVDVEELVKGEGKVKKKVKIVTAGDGEITPEMRAKIDAMISEFDDGDAVWHQKGEGVMVFNSSDEHQKVRIMVREDGHEYVTGDSDVKVEQTENADGSRTIRVIPENGGETTVITIQKEKASKNDK